ncbi:PepSY-associated TM helix domain-containing protein [Celeribacter sp. SCSIO 80788]|uniref:PepSY-associated TM helix domain-containing protein n=1 Tax=Celeribacter sp. SCSIO 80788 TaxID=3117013 RepID=UPI003DA2D9A7
MVALDQSPAPQETQDTAGNAAKFYRAAWRWHFYAGLYVIPFLIMLALTGLGIMWSSVIEGRDGEYIYITPAEGSAEITAPESTAPKITVPVSMQAEAALAAVPGGNLLEYIAPVKSDTVALFRIDTDHGQIMAAVNPFTAEVVETFPRREGWYQFFENIHGELMIGTLGDRLIEIAASLGIILIVTGVYLWWPRGGGLRTALIPNLKARGRALWKTLHATVGIWMSVFLTFFLLSGLAWSGIWGDRLTQAWSTFPAEKWGAPLSDKTHGDLNPGYKLMPWALEQTPLPASGSLAGADGITEGLPVTFDTVDAYARALGFDHRYRLAFPQSDTGVWTMTRDSMSLDSTDPLSDRTLHLDQYSGKILADVQFAEYSVPGKAMAVGMALHMGTAGWWSIVFNTVYCLLVVFLCVSGAVMWWKRRPAGSLRIAPPPMPQNMPLWKGAVALGLLLCFAFPMAGLTLLAVLLLDWLVVSRVPVLKRALL